jgi:hypothetical protein
MQSWVEQNAASPAWDSEPTSSGDPLDAAVGADAVGDGLGAGVGRVTVRVTVWVWTTIRVFLTCATQRSEARRVPVPHVIDAAVTVVVAVFELDPLFASPRMRITTSTGRPYLTGPGAAKYWAQGPGGLWTFMPPIFAEVVQVRKVAVCKESVGPIADRLGDVLRRR